MKPLLSILILTTLTACKQAPEKTQVTETVENSKIFKVVFASCNDPHRPMPLWSPILKNEPNLFIWGGDNIYADTEDMSKMRSDYQMVLEDSVYKKLSETTTIIGTWDDHDYGKNDAGMEWSFKKEAKSEFLQFIKNYPKELETREGIYYSFTKDLEDNKKIKFLLLDTRTFRDSLKTSKIPGRRYDSWTETDTKTLLGTAQWSWLESELMDETPDFTVIVSSIQFLSNEHGWEKWGNFPGEVNKMQQLLLKATSKNIIFFSGDRHLAEISKMQMNDMAYPIIDFTSSGLTHTWLDGATEANPHRISNVVKQLNFGVIKFDLNNNLVTFEIRGKDNFLYEQFSQKY